MRLSEKLFDNSNTKSLGVFRILFGLVILWELARVVLSVGGSKLYIDPVFHFKFPFFEWVKIVPDWLVYPLLAAGCAAAILFTLGLYYRFSAVLLTLIYSYFTLIDVSYWNNHYYFYMLLLFIFCFINAHHHFSIDAKRKSLQAYVPNWNIWLLQFQIVLVLFFGGISKMINPDWLSGLACEEMLAHRLSIRGVDASDSVIYYGALLMTWGGFIFDLLIGFILLSRRWFGLSLLLFLAFNLSNSYLFHIGSFPFAMLGSLVLFLPRKLEERFLAYKPTEGLSSSNRNTIVTGLILYSAFQILFPLRHFLYTGNVIWTSEGKLGAWHMMSGNVSLESKTFFVVIKDEDNFIQDTVTVSADKHLTQQQVRCFSKYPVCIKEFSDYLEDELAKLGSNNVSIYSNIMLGRNGRKTKPIVPIDLDLTTVKRKTFGHNEWILLYREEGM